MFRLVLRKVLTETPSEVYVSAPEGVAGSAPTSASSMNSASPVVEPRT